MKYFRYQGPLTVLATLTVIVSSALGKGQRPSPVLRGAAPSHTAARPPQKFTCLPKDVTLDEAVSYGLKSTQKVTVEKKLMELKARCRNGKLVDTRGREIRFFRVSCWGNPPPDYLEIQQRENKQLADLKRRYTVIVFSCNPMIQ
jgi:hypothetical protein